MKFIGRVWKFGNDVNTDEIIPARYLNSSDPKELAAHVMEDADPEFPSKVRPGDIIVGGKNFGCGSSREHAPLAIKAAGLPVVLAGSFARIFYRNAFNMGLPILEAPEAVREIIQGDEIEVDLDSGRIEILRGGQVFQARPVPPFMQELVHDGGLIEHIKKRIASDQKK
ncbi:MAG: 3-isopropylmalate dehydratase small subunit [Pseudomonadota bacterium]